MLVRLVFFFPAGGLYTFLFLSLPVCLFDTIFCRRSLSPSLPGDEIGRRQDRFIDLLQSVWEAFPLSRVFCRINPLGALGLSAVASPACAHIRPRPRLSNLPCICLFTITDPTPTTEPQLEATGRENKEIQEAQSSQIREVEEQLRLSNEDRERLKADARKSKAQSKVGRACDVRVRAVWVSVSDAACGSASA